MMNKLNLSRRDFLKLSASGALALALSEMGIDRALAAPPSSQGRITWSGVPLYDALKNLQRGPTKKFRP